MLALRSSCPFEDAYPSLIDQVHQGKVSEAAIDRAVSHLLRDKFDAGLFENPYVDPGYAEKLVNNTEHQQLALKAAHETIVLLKNQNDLLPLEKAKYKHIAVIGPNAADLHLGGYSNKPGRGVGLLQAIKDKVGSSAEVTYSEGCKITETLPDWDADKVVLGDPVLNAKRIQEAVAVAKKSDIVILALGENEQTSREAWAKDHLGDRDSLDLLGNQDDLVKAILPLGKPVIVYLQHGRPNSINYIAENVPAILDGWYLGQEGGAAIADVIFGDYNPGGKLPITVPRSVGQLPDYYYQKPSAKRGFLGASIQPLFPFGWGLSYTSFKYENLHVTPLTMGPEGTVTVSVDVTNTGKRSGAEVAQLYIRDEVSSVTRPVKELRGFQRITLEPGKTQTVTFKLGPDELSFLNREMHRVVEPGTFKIMVGGNSVDLIESKLNIVSAISVAIRAAIRVKRLSARPPIATRPAVRRTLLLLWAGFLVVVLQLSAFALDREKYIDPIFHPHDFVIAQKTSLATILVDQNDYAGVLRAAGDLQADIVRVTGRMPELVNQQKSPRENLIIIGTLGKSLVIDQLVRENKIDLSSIKGKWESFLIEVVPNPMPGVASGLVIAGSDKRGTIFGIYDLSEQIGVSPWYWWADVPVAA